MKDINIDAVAEDSDLGKGWVMYIELSPAVSTASVQAERVLSNLSRILSKLRWHLHCTSRPVFEFLMGKTLGCEIADENIIDEILKTGDW